jgi:hypothetical protein
VKKSILAFTLAFVWLPLYSGCNNPSSEQAMQPTEMETANESMEGGHSHSHDELGPHGGHLLHLKPSNVHAEWTHDDDTHLITVHLDDFDADKLTAAKFVVKVGEQTEEFPLAPGDEGWSVTSEALMNHINMGEAADVQLVVTDDQGDHTTKIEAHDHHHH